MFSQCCICLCKNETLHSIIDTDDDKVSWQEKLKSLVSEEFPESLKLCELCCEEVDRVIKFRKHCLQALERTKTEVFSCTHCNKTYSHKTTLLRHITRFHTNKELKQPYSPQPDLSIVKEESFSPNPDLSIVKEEPSRSPNPDLPILKVESLNGTIDDEVCPTLLVSTSYNIQSEFPCDICSSVLRTKYRLNWHRKNVHALEKRFVCDQCSKCFVNQTNLNAHMQYHSKERTHVCTKCGKRFLASSDLYHHEKTHATVRAFRCEVCVKSFKTASDRYKHQLCVHSDPATWRFACRVCERKFPLSSNRTAHERTHTPSKPHRCHLCDRAYSTAFTLKRHILAHSDEKRFKCTEHECDAEYKTSGSLSIHKLQKHGENPSNLSYKALVRESAKERKKITYNCHLCPKSFVSKVKLNKHICSHTGEKPFPCNRCDKRFIDKSYVKEHMKIAHNNISN